MIFFLHSGNVLLKHLAEMISFLLASCALVLEEMHLAVGPEHIESETKTARMLEVESYILGISLQTSSASGLYETDDEQEGKGPLKLGQSFNPTPPELIWYEPRVLPLLQTLREADSSPSSSGAALS